MKLRRNYEINKTSEFRKAKSKINETKCLRFYYENECHRLEIHDSANLFSQRNSKSLYVSSPVSLLFLDCCIFNSYYLEFYEGKAIFLPEYLLFNQVLVFYQFYNNGLEILHLNNLFLAHQQPKTIKVFDYFFYGFAILKNLCK